MTVYVDDAEIPNGKSTVCHMFADENRELHVMARMIKAKKQRYKRAKTAQRHYRITTGMRTRALARGAVKVSMMDAAWMIHHRERTGKLPELKTNKGKSDI